MDYKKLRHEAHIRGLVKKHAELIQRIEDETTALLAKRNTMPVDYELYVNSAVFFLYMDKIRETRVREIKSVTTRLKGTVTLYKVDGYTKEFLYEDLYGSKAALLESL